MALSDLDSSPEPPSPSSDASIDLDKKDSKDNKLTRELVYNRSPCPTPAPPSGRRLVTPNGDASAAIIELAGESIDEMIDECGPMSPNTTRLYAERPVSPDNRDISILLPNTSVEQAETIVKQGIAWREEDAPVPDYRSDGDYDFDGYAKNPRVNVMARDLFGFPSERHRKLKKAYEFMDIVYDDDNTEDGGSSKRDDIDEEDNDDEQNDAADAGCYYNRCSIDSNDNTEYRVAGSARSWETVDSDFHSDNDWEEEYGGCGTRGACGDRLPFPVEGDGLKGVGDQFADKQDAVSQEEKYRSYVALLPFSVEGNDFEDADGRVDGGSQVAFSGNENAVEAEFDENGNLLEPYVSLHDDDHGPITHRDSLLGLRGGCVGFDFDEEKNEVGGYVHGDDGEAQLGASSTDGDGGGSSREQLSSSQTTVAEGILLEAPFIASQLDGCFNMRPLALSRSHVEASPRDDQGKGRALTSVGAGFDGADRESKRPRDDDEYEDMWRGCKRGRVDLDLVRDSGPSSNNHPPVVRKATVGKVFMGKWVIREGSGLFHSCIFQ